MTIFTSCDEPIIKDLEKDKRKHSKRVAELTTQLTDSKDVYDAAFYHDYLEEVGEEERLSANISDRSYFLVEMLTHDEDVDVLEDLKSKIGNLSDSEIIDQIIIIKVCDRIDNLSNRKKSKKYRKKSAKVIQFLYDNYSNKKVLKKFIKDNLYDECPKIKKYLSL